MTIALSSPKSVSRVVPTLAFAAMAFAGIAVVPGTLLAQVSSTRVGIVGGWLTNEQLWQPTAETERVGGLIAGAFAQAQTPADWFSVVLEGLYVQRGGNVVDDIGGPQVTGGVRSDYLSFAVHARVTARFGRASVHVSGGPTIEQLLFKDVDPSLTPVLERESPTVLAASAAVGVGARITPRVHVEIEARIVEGLGDAHAGNFVSFRNRSKEVVVRVGIPLPGR